MEKIWIYGAGGHATVVADLIIKSGSHEIIGIIDDDPKNEGKQFFGIPVVGNFEKFERLNQDLKVSTMFLAIGDNNTREKLALQLTDFMFPVFIHPSVVIGDSVEISAGTIIMPGAIIEPQSRIGHHCIINNAAVVGHGSIIDDFCHISGGAIASGQVNIGKGSFLGIGSCITPTIKIGEKCLIGAGAVVTKNVPDNTFMFGNPARVVSNYLGQK